MAFAHTTGNDIRIGPELLLMTLAHQTYRVVAYIINAVAIGYRVHNRLLLSCTRGGPCQHGLIIAMCGSRV